MSSVSDVKPFTFQKQIAEKETIGVDFSRRIPAGVTITVTSVVSALYNNTPEQIQNMTGTPLQVSSVSLVKKVLSCLISDGEDGFNYKVTFTITLSDGQVKQDEVIVNVREE